MQISMKNFALAVMLMVCMSATAVMAQSCEVPQALWERPRSGMDVLAQPALRQCVQAWMKKPAAQLVIHHSASDESQLQAAELRYWLIALAIDGDRIELMEDLRQNELMNMEIREPQ